MSRGPTGGDATRWARGAAVPAIFALALLGCGDDADGPPDDGGMDAASPIDAGAPPVDAGAPPDDAGERADAGPVRPDASVDAGGAGCDRPCGLGAHCESGACGCDEGRAGDPLVLCEPPDPCGADHGGCDGAVACVLVEGEPTCGACPPGYVGSAEAECRPSPTEHLRALPTIESRVVRYYANRDPSEVHDDVVRAVVVVHGTERNADDYYLRMHRAAELAGALRSTLIVAPWFEIAADAPPPEVLYWDDDGDWKRGDPSTRDLPAQVSAFAIVDALLREIGDPRRRPNLRRVVVVGHSAGGQYVQRYALGSRVEASLPDATVRYVPANPSSYAYLGPERATDTVGARFEVPTTSCASYDDWKYGLRDLNPYMAEVGADAARAQYRGRDVAYMVGEDDDDPAAAGLDTGCEAALQGAHRLERGLLFFAHVADHYGEQPHRLIGVPGVGHSSTGMFQSPEGREVVFGARPP